MPDARNKKRFYERVETFSISFSVVIMADILTHVSQVGLTGHYNVSPVKTSGVVGQIVFVLGLIAECIGFGDNAVLLSLVKARLTKMPTDTNILHVYASEIYPPMLEILIVMVN